MSDKRVKEVMERIAKLEEDNEKDQQEKELIRHKVRELNKKIQDLAKIIRS